MSLYIISVLMVYEKDFLLQNLPSFPLNETTVNRRRVAAEENPLTPTKDAAFCMIHSFPVAMCEVA